tara:strand:- start:3192 stop:4187 length:996 start_codon:yes stop_codon:yes gene_type:complete
MNIVFWGTPDYAAENLHAIHELEHNIVAVVTQPDKRRSRGSSVDQSPVKRLAISLNIPVLTPKRVRNNTLFMNQLKELKADMFIVVAYGKILPKEILEYPLYGCWNSHASLLPKLRGAAPMQWSIINGDRLTGVSIMLMDQGLDTGPILLKDKIEILNEDNIITLSSKMSNLSSSLLLKLIEIINIYHQNKELDYKKLLNLTYQNKTNISPSYARLINKADCIVNWNDNAKNIHRMIRGFHPNAYSIINNKRIKVLSCKIFNKKFNDINPGTIIEVINKSDLLVTCYDSSLQIEEIQIEGKKPIKGSNMIQQVYSLFGEIVGIKFTTIKTT